MRKTVCAVLVAILLLFSTCGMPSYHDFDSTISISTASSVPGYTDVAYVAGFQVTIHPDSYYNYIDDQSPAVLLMYSVIENDRDSTLVRNFNRNIGGSSSYNNGVAATFGSDGSLNNVEDTEGNATVHMYRFLGENGSTSYSTTPSYTKSLDLSQSGRWYFMFSQVDGTQSDFHFELDIYTYDGTTATFHETITLYRGSGTNNTWPKTTPEAASGSDYAYYRSGSGTDWDYYEINFYCSVNIVSASGASFSNTYWERLSSDYMTIDT